MSIAAKLHEMGLGLNDPPAPIAAYVPTMRVGNLVYVSGQLPITGGQMLASGKVPSQVSVEQAQEAARECVLNALSALKAEAGEDLAGLKRVVRLGVFVQSDDTFTDQAMVANGASEFLEELLGNAGKHVRAAVGVNALPKNAAVEVEFLFEVE